MDEKAKDVRAQQWIQTIHACNTSGMRKADWCQANGVNLKSFYNWQKRLRIQLACNVERQLPAQASQAIVWLYRGQTEKYRVLLEEYKIAVDKMISALPEAGKELVEMLEEGAAGHFNGNMCVRQVKSCAKGPRKV